MSKSKRFPVLFICFIGTSISLWLSLGEIQAPGLCPCYPGTGIPACYSVLALYILVGISEFIPKPVLANRIFFACALVGILTATFFSLAHLMGVAQCPKIGAIPLCFIAFLSFVMLLTIGSARSKITAAVPNET